MCGFFRAGHHNDTLHLFTTLVLELLLCVSILIHWLLGEAVLQVGLGHAGNRAEQKYVTEPILSIFTPLLPSFLHILWWAVIFPHYFQPEIKSL